MSIDIFSVFIFIVAVVCEQLFDCSRHEIETQHDNFVEKKNFMIVDRKFSSYTNHNISNQ